MAYVIVNTHSDISSVGVTFDEIALPWTPTTGNTLLAFLVPNDLDIDTYTLVATPDDFTLLTGHDFATTAKFPTIAVFVSEADGTDTFAIPGTADERPVAYVVLEVSGFDGLPMLSGVAGEGYINLDEPVDVPAVETSEPAETLAVAVLCKDPATPNGALDFVGDYTLAEDSGFVGSGRRTRIVAWYRQDAVPPDEYGPYTVMGATDGTEDGHVINVALWTPGTPTEPPVEPEYPPVEPARAILEIKVPDPDSSRWGSATWDPDDTPGGSEGTEGIWSSAGWQDITPQGLTAHVRWGSTDPQLGILARQSAGVWTVDTFDPDRLLDPGNPDSPYAPHVVAGMPIRISHNGHVIRTGYCDEIAYSYTEDGRVTTHGRLSVVGPIALAAQAKVPEDTVLSDDLRARIDDVLTATGVAIDGIPLRPKVPAPFSPVLSDKPTGELSAWEHIRLAAEEVLYVVYENSAADLSYKPWGAPSDRGTEITDANMIDLVAYVSDDGLYSVVRALDSVSLTVEERVATPTPTYGKRVYDRGDLTTIDAAGWTAAVLGERSAAGVRWRPGQVQAFTAADVDLFAGINIMERIRLTVVGVVSVTAKVLGGELWVRNDPGRPGATWRFRWETVTEGSTGVGDSVLVADGTGDILLDDATGLDYLLEDV